MKPARPVASDQLGFGFEEPSPAPVSPAKPPAKKISPAASAPHTNSSNTAAVGSAEAMARTLEAIGLADGQREHFANLSLFIANSLLNTTPHKAVQRLLNKVF